MLSVVFDEFLSVLGISKFKFFTILGAVIIIGLLAFSYINRGYIIDKLKEDKVELEVDKTKLEEGAKLDKALDSVKEKTKVDLDKGIKKVSDRHNKVMDNVKDKVENIKNDNKDKIDIESIRIKQNNISAVYINGLWDAYCAGNPNIPSCLQRI